MSTVVLVVQIALALVILNVWLLRVNRATNYRGGHATSMREEFEVYGLPPWMLYIVGVLKVLFAVSLIVGIWVPQLTAPAASGLGALMLGAVLMHVKVKDPLQKTLPALTMLILCLLVAFL